MEDLKVLKTAEKNLPLETLAELIVGFIQDKKGKDIVSLNLSAIPEAVADYFIICHADSTTQVRAIVDNVEYEAAQIIGKGRINLEGRSNGEWALADLGDIVVHVFQTEKRAHYMLEELWSDAKIKVYENV